MSVENSERLIYPSRKNGIMSDDDLVMVRPVNKSLYPSDLHKVKSHLAHCVIILYYVLVHGLSSTLPSVTVVSFVIREIFCVSHWSRKSSWHRQ